ncbi:hypothetical protein VE02_09718 [Pseudogymnoascus sp. 03VT05]|nr:hypothetical protein VE02_09718 [Pseudogymnoascus sp. 03VT05]
MSTPTPTRLSTDSESDRWSPKHDQEKKGTASHQNETSGQARHRRSELSGSDLSPEPKPEPKPEPELWRRSRARVPALPRTELQAISDPIIEQAKKATQKARVMTQQALWLDIIIPTSTKQVTLTLAARGASTSS